jgi:hypothetical protein
MTLSPVLARAISVGLESDLVNNTDVTELMRGAEESAMYLWTKLKPDDLVQVTKDLRNLVVAWDPDTVRQIEEAMNAFFIEDQEETHLRPAIQHLVDELKSYLVRTGISDKPPVS